VKRGIKILEVLIALLFVAAFTGCHNTNQPVSYVPLMGDPDAQNMYISVFPVDVSISLGKKVGIINANVIIEFVSVTNLGKDDNSVLLDFNYGDWDKEVTMIINSAPSTYDLENGYHYEIRLKSLEYKNGNYVLTFIIDSNAGGYL